MSSLLQASTCCPFKLMAMRCSWWTSVRTQGSWETMAQMSIYQSLLSSFSAEVHTAKTSYFHNKINSASDTHNHQIWNLGCQTFPTITESIYIYVFISWFIPLKTNTLSKWKKQEDIRPTLSPASPHSFLNVCNPQDTLLLLGLNMPNAFTILDTTGIYWH